MKSRNLRTLVALFILVSLASGGLWPTTAQEPERLPATPISQAGFKAGEVLVKFKRDAFASTVENALERHQAVRLRFLYGSDVQLWRVPEGREMAIVEQLNANPAVLYAEPNYVYHAFDTTPNDPRFAQQWAHTRMQSAAGWDITTGSTSITIAIIDSGIDEGHPDLSSKIVAGHDFVDDDNDPHDLNGHGTHVAGIAAAVTNNAVGVAGMDWQARIMPIRVLDREGSGLDSDIADGITWAYQHGADVLNLSLGGEGYSQTMQDAINAAHAAGSLVVAAMGNCRTLDPPACPAANPTNYPAANDNVMAVAATTLTDGYAYYSQYGSHCDIAAPGGEITSIGDPDGILSTLPTYSDFFLRTAYGFSRDYDFLQGTSMATPYVSGLAALIWATDPTLTPDQVQNTIQITADDLGPTGWDQDFGWGRINTWAALQSFAPPAAPVLSPISNPDGDGNYLVDWNDVAGATSYTLQEDGNSAFTSPAVRYTGTSSQYSVGGQETGTWYYRVRASNASGDSPWSNVQAVAVKPAAPVLNPINNPDGDGTYLVDWNDVVGAAGYTLQEDNTSAFTSPSSYSTANSQYWVSGQEGGTWYYRVCASNDAGDGPWSNTQSVVVKPAAPVLDSVTNPGHEDEYQVTWSAVAGAAGYTLQEDDHAAFGSPATRYAGTATQYSVTGQQGGAWYYRVRASNAAGDSPWSNLESTIVAPPTLDPPDLFSIDNADGDGDYLVDWSDVTSATSYVLEQSPDPYFAGPAEVYAGGDSQFQVADQPGGTWYYRVRAFGAGTDKSPWSSPRSALVTSWVYLPLVTRSYRPDSSSGLPINEGFEGGLMPPSGWIQIVNNSNHSWIIDESDPFSGLYSASVYYDPDKVPQDEVLISPYFEASAATLSFWSLGSLYWCRDTKDNCDLNVWLVIGPWGGGDDIHVHTADDDWTGSFVWSSSTVDLTPFLPAGTPVRVAFQYLGQDGDQIGLDAITISSP